MGSSFLHRRSSFSNCRVRQGGTSGGGGLERLLKISNDIVNVLCTDRNTDAILCRARVKTLLVSELLMSCRPRVNCKSLGIPNTIYQLVQFLSIRE